MPSSDTTEDEIQQFSDALDSIELPVSREEAELLVTVLPVDEDDCYGMIWGLVHKIETAASSFDNSFKAKLRRDHYWETLLLTRIANGGI